MDALVRSFVGIKLPLSLHEGLQKLQQELRQRAAGADIKWVGLPELHITLHFFGEIRLEQVAAAQKSLTEVCSRHACFDLKIVGHGGFPSSTQPRILWAGLGGDLDALRKLQAEIETAMLPHSTHQDTKPFQPHLTLGRLRNETEAGRTAAGRSLRVVQSREIGEWEVTQIDLLRSAVTSTGPTYTSIEAYPLASLGRLQSWDSRLS